MPPEKLIDKREMLRFFNERAGRELWQEKDKEIQDADIKNADEILSAAISALSHPQGDLISRQAVKTALVFAPSLSTMLIKDLHKVVDVIDSIPSSQPDIEQIRQEIENINPIDYVESEDYEGLYNAERFKQNMLDIIDKHIETMREATPEERQSVDDYIDSISTTVDLEAIRQEIFHLDRYNERYSMVYNRPDLIDLVVDDVLNIIDKHLQK